MSVMKGVYQRIGRRQAGKLLGSATDINVRAELGDLNQRLDALALTCEALWELLQEQTDTSDEMIIAKMQEIDMRDGEDDNRIGSTQHKCSRCGRTISQRHQRCLYCGQDFSSSEVFASS
jgi:ribosomal protein S27AE